MLTYDKHDYHGGKHDWIALIKRVLFHPIVEEDEWDCESQVQKAHCKPLNGML